MGRWRIIVYCPAYNAEKTMGELLERAAGAAEKLAAMGASLDSFIVIDDGSTDRTGAILKSCARKFSFLKIINKRQNQGPSSAVFGGMAAALARAKKSGQLGRAILVRMDSDLEHQPEDLPAVVAPIISGKSDLSIGVLPIDSRNGIAAEWFNKTVGKAESMEFLGIPIPQFDPGFHAFRADRFAKLCPKLLRLRPIFRKKYGMDMLLMDFILFVLAKRSGMKISTIGLRPIQSKFIKKQPVSKLAGYWGYHVKTCEFLRSLKSALV